MMYYVKVFFLISCVRPVKLYEQPCKRRNS